MAMGHTTAYAVIVLALIAAAAIRGKGAAKTMMRAAAGNPG
jgi:hypothetical protein